MAINIRTTTDIHVEGIKIVLYGNSGVGKTVLCSTAPSPLIISAEKGLLSLSDQAIDFIQVMSLKDVGDAYNFITKSEEATKYKTICIDSISELTEVCLLEIKNKMIKDSDTGKIDARQSYGKLAESVGTMIRRFRDLQHHDVVMVAKQKRMEDEDGGTYWFEPYLPGRVLPFNLPYLVDEVFCMQLRRNGDRYLQTVGDRRFICKDRSGKLDAEEVPNLTAVFNKIRGK